MIGRIAGPQIHENRATVAPSFFIPFAPAGFRGPTLHPIGADPKDFRWGVRAAIERCACLLNSWNIEPAVEFTSAWPLETRRPTIKMFQISVK